VFVKKKVDEFQQTIRQGRFTIVMGQTKIGKKIVRYAGATLLNEEDSKYDAGNSRNLATARAMKSASEQIQKMARAMEKRTYRRIKANEKARQERRLMKSSVPETMDMQEEETIESMISAETEKKVSIDGIQFTDEDIITFLTTPSMKAVSRELHVSDVTILTWRNKIRNKGFDSLSDNAKEKIMKGYLESQNPNLESQNLEDQVINETQEYQDDLGNRFIEFLGTRTIKEASRELDVSDKSIDRWKNILIHRGWDHLSDFAKQKIHSKLAA
jgi:transposase